MASRAVARYLQELHRHCNNDSKDSPSNGQQTLKNLRDIVLKQRLTNEEQDLCSSMLFLPSESSPDLLTEFMSSLIDKRFAPVRYLIVKLIIDYIDYIDKNIFFYASRIQSSMIKCINTDQSDKTRSTALQCLDKLYLLTSFDMHSSLKSKVDDDEDNDIKMDNNNNLERDSYLIPIENVINIFYNNLNLGVSKLRGTVRGGILRLLGILSNRYPLKFTRNHLNKLCKLYTKYIGESIKEPNKLQPGLISGCLTGLEYFLNEHCDYIPIKTKEIHCLFTIFKMIIITTRTIQNESRYGLVIASLDLLNRHSFIFLPFIMKMVENTSKLKKTQYEKAKNGDVLQLILDLCINHNNMNVSLSAMNCIESMLSSITNELIQNNENDKNKKIYTMLLTIFGKLLSKSIASGNTNNILTVNNKQISISIRAFGQLSNVINIYSNSDTLPKLLKRLVQVSKKCFILTDDQEDDGDDDNKSNHNSILKQFPAFLSAFSSIIHHIDYIDDDVIDQLSLMFVMIYKGFPSTYSKLRDKLYQSMIRLFVVLYLKGNIFNKLLEIIIYRGLTYSITTLAENCIGTKVVDTSKMEGIAIRTCYEEYYSFWYGLLMIGINIDDNDDALKWNKGLNFDIQQTQKYLYEMRSLLFSSLMQNLIQILTQFNLQFNVKDDDMTNHQMVMNNISENAELSNANDMELFLNYVEFIQLFFGRICREYLMNKNKTRKRINPYFLQFQSWSMIFIENLIEKSNANSMISGLYKILKCIFSLYATSTNMDQEEIKQNDDDDEEEQDILMMDDNNNNNNDERIKRQKLLSLDSYHKNLIRDYIDKCLSKLQMYRDELLYSCIELLLNIPRSFLRIKYLIGALIKALEIGLTHIPAGELAVGTLEKWCDEYIDEIKEYFNIILPNLEPYLLITKETVAGISSNDDEDENEDKKNNEADDFDEDDEKQIVLEHNNNNNKSVSNKKNKTKQSALNNIDEEGLEYERKKRLIRRILLFLGKLGGYNQSLLLPKTNKLKSKHISDAEAAGKGLAIDTDIIAWDKHLRVRYLWAFPDTKLVIYLDSLLPRICELALNSTNRRTKVAACEALHGIIIKMVADNATDPNMDRRGGNKSKKEDFEKIYQKLFPVILHLAVSVEKVCNQLFRPLVIQLIHWFTQNIKKDNDETIALLDAITDGLGNEHNASLRDFCGECMAEFVKWSLKNSGSLAGSLNIQSLLRRLYALVRHPSAYRRLGACLTFHYIYRNIREEKLLVSRFILDILSNLIESLAIAHYDQSGIDTKGETRRCIKHFEKIIIHQKHGYYEILNKIDKQRQGGDHCKDLSTFIEWLFENLGRIEIECRRQCMMLIQSLTPISRSINNSSKIISKSISNWFAVIIKQRKVQYIVSVFEGGRLYIDDNTHSVLAKLPKLPTNQDINQYPKLAMLLKFKKWVENLSTSLDDYYWMIDSKVIEGNNSDIITKLFTQKHFQSFLFASCKHFLASLKILNKVSFIGAVTLKKQINKLRCDTTMRFYRFINIMLRNDLFKVVEELFKFQLFYQLLFESLVVPNVIGFIKDDPSRIKEFQNQFKSLIIAICNKCNEKYKKYVIKICHGYINGKLSPHSTTNSNNKNKSKSHLSINYTEWTSTNFFKFPGKALLFLRGMEILSKTHSILQLALDKNKNDIAAAMADDVFALCDEPLHPMNIKVCRAMLSIALRLELSSNNLMQYLSDQTRISLAHSNISSMIQHNKERNNNMMDQDDDEEDILAINDEEMLLADSEEMQNGSKGLVFYERFADVLDSYFLANFDEFSKIILLRIGDTKMEESEKRQLMLILTTVLKHIIDDSSAEETQKFLSNLITQFSNNTILDRNTEENMRLHLAIIRQYLMKCGSNNVFEDKKNNKITDYIQSIYCSALKNGKHSSAQLQAINMLPLFIIDSDNLFSWLLQSIHEMICNSFPNTSEEAYNKSKAEWKDYVQKLQSILDTIIVSESFGLLKVSIPLFREKHHKNKQQIDQKLDHLIGNLTHPLKQQNCLKLLTFATDCFLDEDFDTNSKDNARRWMVESLCVPILESAAISLVDKYFQKFAKTIFEIICKYPNGPDRSKDRDTIRLQLLDLECAYKLLAVQYERLHKKSVEKIGVEYKSVIKTAHNHVKKFGVQGKQESYSQIAFHCAAYNCLAQCILCTQKEGSLNIWTMLFTEKLNKAQVLWSNIIDLNIELMLSIDTNFVWSLRRIRRRFLQNEAEHGLTSQNLFALDPFLSQPQAIIGGSSLRNDFANLSLSQTGQYSFQPKREGNHNKNHNLKEEMDQDEDDDDDDIDGMDVDDDDDDDDKEKEEEQEIVLELDPLNSMPIMNSILSAMDGLQKHFKNKWKESIPKWMDSILSKLKETDTMSCHPNIRYFIAKLILNRPKIFEPFADLFFKPLIDLFVTDTVTNYGFHYFIRDICELFLFKWPRFIPDTMMDDSPQRFINHLINMVTDFGIGAAKNRKIEQNINYIQLLLVKWKGIETVNKKYLYQLLSVDNGWKPDFDNLSIGDKVLMDISNKNKTASKVIPVQITKRTQKGTEILYRVKVPGNAEIDNIKTNIFYKRDLRLERCAALWVIDALTEANFPAFDIEEDKYNNDGIDINKFFAAFCSNFTVNSLPIWKAAAKVYGDLLRKEDENIRKSSSFKRSFSIPGCIEKIKKIISKTIKTDLPKAIEIMHRIGNESPEFLDHKLMQQILGSLGRIPIGCLTDSISLFAKYVSVDNPDPEVAIWLRPGLKRIFNHNDIGAHLAVCDVFLRLIPFIEKDIKEEFLPDFISNFKDHKNHKVRRKLLGILSHIFDNEKDIDITLRNQTKEVLLAALSDQNRINRKLMFEFWGHSTRLNETIVERMNDLLTNLFTTKNEHLWLHYSSFLLLEPMRKSPDFKQLISHRPLSECQFEEMYIDSQWASDIMMTQNFGMTPMFSSSIPSKSQQTDEYQRTLATFSSLTNGEQQPGFGYIRATQQKIWTQTQLTQSVTKLPSPTDKPERSGYGSGAKETFMWTQNDNNIALNDNDDNDLHELFAGSYADFKRGPQGKGIFDGIRNKKKNKNKNKVRVMTLNMSQRYSAKQAKKIVSKRIGAHDKKKRYKVAWEERQRDVAAHRVSLYRKYRRGELPDICIPHSDIQLPLQALHTDPVIAKQLFIIFFKAIYQEAVKRSDRRNNYGVLIEKSMSNILKECNDHSSIVSTLLLCSTYLNNIQIEAKYIADLSIKSNNLYSGVVLLESMLINGEYIEEQQKPNKRRRIIKKEENASHDALSFNDKIYSQLTRLYNLLNEQDTVLALSCNFAKMQETKDGVEEYMKGNYWNAYHSYLTAQNIAKQQKDRCIASVLEKTLWNEESIKCLHKLAKWDIIYDGAINKIKTIDNNKSFGNNLWNFLLEKEDLDLTEQSALRSWFDDWLLSSVKKENIWNTQLYKYMDEWIINEQLDENEKLKRDFIEGQYSPILAFLYSTRNDLIRTKFYLSKSYEIILSKWCNLPKFAVGAKKLLLSKLQSLGEINEFVNIIKMESKNDNNNKNKEIINDSEDILNFWKRRYPKNTDDVLIWDDITFYRKIFGKKINELQSTDYLKELITECQVETLYESINSMIYQKNYSVAEEYMKNAALLGSFNPKFKIQHIHLSLNSIMDNKKKTDKEKIQSIQQLNERLTNYLKEENMNDFENEMCLLKGKMLYNMAIFADDDGSLLKYIQNERNVNNIYNKSREFYRKSLQTFQDDQDDENDEEKEIKYAVDGDVNMDYNLNGNQDNDDEDNDDDDYDDEEGENEEDEGHEINAAKQKLLREHEANHAKAHIELALFCNLRLLSLEEKVRRDVEKKEENKIKLFTMIREYSAHEIDLGQEFIENIMKAMMYNSDDARDMFPRVLEIAEMNVSVLGPLVIKLSKRIPCWMFIRWIPQMLAELGSQSCLREYVIPILTRIARMYPGALIYPFNLTSEDLENDKSAQKYIVKLRNLLTTMPGYDLASSFTEALDCMCHPNLKFGDFKKEIQTIIGDKRLNKKEKTEKIEESIKDMIYQLFTSSKKYVKKLIGLENQRFIRLFGKTIFSKFGKNGEKVKTYSNNLSQISKILDSITKIKEYDTFISGKKKGGKLALKEYSDWLSSFDSSKFDESLYVPGQYGGMVKPDISQHLKIVSFDSITLIMGSLRKPKRIKLRTNDEREQMWLAKAGEDLRMDERIEQMFKIINTILTKNTLCIERNLILRTYDVIPLNRSTGIIEWIPNTIPIKSLIEDSMRRLKIKQSMTDIILKDYIEPFVKLTRQRHGAKMYTNGILQINKYHKKLLNSFEKTQNRIPPTTLQLSIINMSRNKESYIQLRNRFCKTLSVYTICGYILGIGDRHLDNYLVDESTGQVIGIDFGAAFGYGLGLPVPELMPCRLTRQFLNILYPLNTKIHCRNYMIYVMTALSEKKDNLLNIMNVFIKEPSLDWIELANKNFQKSNAKDLMDKFDEQSLSLEIGINNTQETQQSETQNKELLWYPKHKIYIAKLKLNMFKSTYVMIEEINSTQHFTAKFRKPMEDLINGFGNNKQRKILYTKNKCESIQDQIDCLIDHAVDKNILSLTWQGWLSWI